VTGSTATTAQLATSLHHFLGTTDYNPETLRIDLARFGFLLRADDGTQVFDLNKH
jgi:hypothetical protein